MDQAEPAAHPHRWGRPAQRHPGDPPQNGQDLGCSRGTIFEIFIGQQSQRNRVKNLIFYRSFLADQTLYVQGKKANFLYGKCRNISYFFRKQWGIQKL